MRSEARTRITVALLAAWALAMSGGMGRAASPTVYLQNSTIVGASGTLTISRLPSSNGTTTIYHDVTIPFTATSTGQIVVGTATITTSPTLITSKFVPGTYTTLGGKADATIHVNGPNSGNAGTTVWSLAAVAPDTSTPLTSVRWMVGPISENTTALTYLTTNHIPVDPDASYGLCETPALGSFCLAALNQTGNAIAITVYNSSSVFENLTYTRTGP